MLVREIMTERVATVGQEASLKQVAELMLDRGVSGLPVTNAERVVLGVISESDLIAKEASRPESAGLLGHIAPTRGLDERRLAAVTAAQAMSSPAVTVEAEASVAEAARLMVEHRVKRLPVTEEGRLRGIVSRADLVRAFARPDREVAEELGAALASRGLVQANGPTRLEVAGGRVTISGSVRSETEAELVEATAWRVPGVVSLDLSGLKVVSGRGRA